MNSLTRKNMIYNKAALLFRSKGYSASSMRDIALAVGLEPSSLYSHISSKEAILKAICFDCGERFLIGIESITNSDENAITKLYDIISLHIDIAIDNPSSVTVFNDEWKHLNEKHLFEFRKNRKQYENDIIQIVKKGIEEDLFIEVDIDIFFKSFLSSLKWIHQSHDINTLKTNKGKINKQLHSIFINGIKMD